MTIYFEEYEPEKWAGHNTLLASIKFVESYLFGQAPENYVPFTGWEEERSMRLARQGIYGFVTKNMDSIHRKIREEDKPGYHHIMHHLDDEKAIVHNDLIKLSTFVRGLLWSKEADEREIKDLDHYWTSESYGFKVNPLKESEFRERVPKICRDFRIKTVGGLSDLAEALRDFSISTRTGGLVALSTSLFIQESLPRFIPLLVDIEDQIRKYLPPLLD